MVRYKLYITSAAKQDLADIASYIAHNLHAPASAKRLVLTIDKRIRQLLEFPHYQIIDEEPFKQAGVCRINIKNYAIFYLVDERKQLLVILAILYAGRLWQRVLARRFTL